MGGGGSGLGFGLVVELEDQDFAVGVKFAAGGGLGGLERVVGSVVFDFRDETGGSQRLFDVVALQVDVGINVVGDAVVALIAFEADVMGGCADPGHLAVDF